MEDEQAVIQALAENARCGFYSRIEYQKVKASATQEYFVDPKDLHPRGSGMLIGMIDLTVSKYKRFFAGRIWAVQRAGQSHHAAMNRVHVFPSIVEAFLGQAMDPESYSAEALQRVYQMPVQRRGLGGERWFHEYTRLLQDVLLNLEVSEEEHERVRQCQMKLELKASEIRAAHAFVLAQELMFYASDGEVDDMEAEYAGTLCQLLAKLGWGPAIPR